MATESVTSIPAPRAFPGSDIGVLLEQASVVADLLGAVDHEQCEARTINGAGLLIWSLLEATGAALAKERAEERQRLAAVKG